MPATCHGSELLRQKPDRKTLTYLGGFLASLGKDAGDARLTGLADKVNGLTGKASPKVLAELAKAVEEQMKALAPV